MAGKQTRGRQRIPIRLIEHQDDLYVTFSKRRLGLYKKASELSTLCGVDIGIIIFSPTDNPFSFFSPSMESVVDRYRNPNQPLNDYARVVEAHTRARIEHLNRRLDEIQEEEQRLKEREKQLDEIAKTRQKGWWEQVPVENLSKDQVKEWKAWFQDFSAKVKNRMEEVRNGASTSVAAFQADQNTPPPPPGAGGYETVIVHNNGIPPTQYYNIHPQAAVHPIFSDGGSGHFYCPPLPGDGGNGTVGQFPIQYNFIPPPVQEFPFHCSYFPPPPPQDPPSSTGGNGSHRLPVQYNYIPQPPQDPSTSSRGAGDLASPSNRGEY